MIFTTLIGLLGIYYGIILLRVYMGISEPKSKKNSSDYMVSVIIPARNEEKYIGRCLDGLLGQNYPAEKTEIIVINDRSEDDTENILRRYAEEFPRVRFITVTTVPPGRSPKKFAVQTGISQSRGEIILATDADTRHGPDWIASMSQQFEPKVGLVLGPVVLEIPAKAGLFPNLQALEFVSYVIFAAGSVGFQWVIVGNGANMAYRRRVFDDAGGFSGNENVISGDDVFFMHSVNRKTGWQTRFALDDKSLVSTEPENNVRSFWNQRARWASKCPRYQRRDVLLMSGIFLFYLLLLLSPIPAMLGLVKWSTIMVLFLLKCLADFCVLYKGLGILKRRRLLRYFPLAELLHIPNIIFVTIKGVFFGFEWKGQRHNTVA